MNNKLPERIYLQWDPHPDAEEITWRVDMVAEGESVDIEYIRADLFAAEEIRDALAESGEWWVSDE